MKEDKKPFYDAIDHFKNVEGNVTDFAKVNFKKLPRLLRYFGYFMFGFFSISILLIIILKFLD
jgi:hypothetical protein